jgi:hypothetical protein
MIAQHAHGVSAADVMNEFSVSGLRGSGSRAKPRQAPGHRRHLPPMALVAAPIELSGGRWRWRRR